MLQQRGRDNLDVDALLLLLLLLRCLSELLHELTVLVRRFDVGDLLLCLLRLFLLSLLEFWLL